jgi:hypothetical protein
MCIRDRLNTTKESVFSLSCKKIVPLVTGFGFLILGLGYCFFISSFFPLVVKIKQEWLDPAGQDRATLVFLSL